MNPRDPDYPYGDTCPACDGEGTVPALIPVTGERDLDPCARCEGTGRTREPDPLAEADHEYELSRDLADMLADE
jgi:hypothetical protein